MATTESWWRSRKSRRALWPAAAPFDLVMTFEVAEHVPAALADRFVAFVTQLGETVVFTAAQPEQGGQGHINEQPKGYWERKFLERGYRVDGETTRALAGALERAGTAEYLYLNLNVYRGARGGERAQ